MKWYIQSKGIKCDAEGCGWREDNVNLDTLEEWRNKPCPKCGSNLLTDKDWQTVILLNKILGSWPVRFLNWFVGLFGVKERTYKVDMNGTGEVGIKEV